MKRVEGKGKREREEGKGPGALAGLSFVEKGVGCLE